MARNIRAFKTCACLYSPSARRQSGANALHVILCSCLPTIGLLAHCPTPNLEDQGITLCPASTRRPIQHGWPDIALRVVETHKLSHHGKVVIPSGQALHVHGSKTKCSKNNLAANIGGIETFKVSVQSLRHVT